MRAATPRAQAKQPLGTAAKLQIAVEPFDLIGEAAISFKRMFHQGLWFITKPENDQQAREPAVFPFRTRTGRRP